MSVQPSVRRRQLSSKENPNGHQGLAHSPCTPVGATAPAIALEVQAKLQAANISPIWDSECAVESPKRQPPKSCGWCVATTFRILFRLPHRYVQEELCFDKRITGNPVHEPSKNFQRILKFGSGSWISIERLLFTSKTKT